MELNTINPFDNEDIKRRILEKEGLSTPTDISHSDDIQFEKEDGTIITPELVPNTMSNLVKNNYNSISKDAEIIIHDAASLPVKDKMARSKEISSALNRVFTEYNEKYGLSLRMDFQNISQSLLYITDQKSFRTLELFLSETFGRFRALIMVKVLQSIVILAEDILDPKRLLSNEVALEDKFIIVEKLLTYVDMIENLYSKVKILGADTELAKLAKDGGNNIASGDGISDEEMRAFLDMVLKKNDIHTSDEEAEKNQ